MMIPLACDMTAIPAAERDRHHQVTGRLVNNAIGIRELPDGILFQLPANDYPTAAQFVDLERLCCPFLRFALRVTPGKGPVSLQIEGPPGTVSFLRLELGLP